MRKEGRADMAEKKGGGNGTNNTSPNKIEFTAAAKIPASQTSEKLRSPAGPKGIVARGKKAASPAADVARCGMILNDRSHQAVGCAAGIFPWLAAPSLASPKVHQPHRILRPLVMGHSHGQHPTPAPLACSPWHLSSLP